MLLVGVISAGLSLVSSISVVWMGWGEFGMMLEISGSRGKARTFWAIEEVVGEGPLCGRFREGRGKGDGVELSTSTHDCGYCVATKTA